MKERPAMFLMGIVAAGLLAGAVLMARPTAIVSSSLSSALTLTLYSTPVVAGEIYRAGGGPFRFANPFAGTGWFERDWTRTDLPIKQGKVHRAWIWGPGPDTPGLLERYEEAPDASGLRLVQYFDKSRMEMNDPHADQNKIGYVTNGLLSVELISGFIQMGDADFVQYHPACLPMSGDPGDPLAPTYMAFQGVSNTQAGDHPAPNLTGHPVTATIDRDGKVGSDPSKASIDVARLAQYEATTQHNIAGVFQDFLQSPGPVYEIVYSNGYRNEKNLSYALLTGPYFSAGLPISEPYWSKATIRGRVTDVLIQAFERWVLTYVPSNPEGFQVEVANIGQHYFTWRYQNAGICPGMQAGSPTPPVLAPQSTIPALTPTLAFPTFSPPTPIGSVTPEPTVYVPLPTGTITPLPLGTHVVGPVGTPVP